MVLCSCYKKPRTGEIKTVVRDLHLMNSLASREGRTGRILWENEGALAFRSDCPVSLKS
jgi:hypothetical protein